QTDRGNEGEGSPVANDSSGHDVQHFVGTSDHAGSGWQALESQCVYPAVSNLHFPARVHDVEPKPALLIGLAADPVIGALHVRRSRQKKSIQTMSIGVGNGTGNLGS